MVTERAIQKGSPMLAVPSSLLMTAETARKSPLCGPLVESKELDDWQALILHLLCERSNPGSLWAPYLELLQHADLSHHPLLWGEDRRAWLQGSPMAGMLLSRREQVERDAQQLAEAGANDIELPQVAGAASPPPLVTPESVGWAAAVLLSRAFSLYLSAEPDHSIFPMDDFGSWDRTGQDVLALVPWADLLQHSSEAGDASVLRYDIETDTAFLCAHRDYSPGDGVYDSYGPGLSPSDLLMDYGFVDPHNSNCRYDALPSDIASPRGPRNRSLLAALDGLQGEGSLLPLGPSGPDTTGLTVLRAALATEAELVRSGWRLKAGPRDTGLAARALGRLSEPGGAATEAAVLGALEQYCSRALAAYPTTLQQDETEMGAIIEHQKQLQGQNGHVEQQRERHLRLQVLRALVSEKRALTGTAAAVAEWQVRLAGGCLPSELYADVSDVDDGGGEEHGGHY